ncbi:MAG: class I SAM-dependent methyltransferase [Gammaproteobacteria bacterium]|nr:class I SAM-dependent methyltransferase [Gammaproteobacteria bacterium]
MSTTGGWDWDKALQEMPGRWTQVADELFSFSREMRNGGCHSVFDLGCGAGRHSVFLAQQGFAVSAADVSPSAIEKTRLNLQQTGTDATLYQIDMTEWPFNDGQFDAVVAFNIVYHAQRAEVETVLEQINRVLSPGGLIFITFKSILDAQCGYGEQLAPFTWAPTSGLEKGIAHYYVDEAEARRLMQDFDLISMVHKQELPVPGQSERHRAHWVIRARKSFE